MLVKMWLRTLLCFSLAFMIPTYAFAQLTDAAKEPESSSRSLADSEANQPPGGLQDRQISVPRSEMRSKEQLTVENSKSMETKNPELQRLTYARLKEGELIDGFRTDAVYVNESDKEIGARFRHVKSGMFVDLVQIESVPQCFIWVNTVPSSDNGAPHTQEHLLLGKGNKGRELGTQNELSLVSSSAMTMPWRTCYHFNTTAGAKVFFGTLRAWLDALLNPDYTDTEIAREVCNLGVKEDPQSRKLSLEEKGTVYNEMQSAMHAPSWPMWLARMEALYGKQHPLTFNSGGSPAGIRTLTADQIRSFHKKHYQLSNMGMICSFPSSVSLSEALSNLDSILSAVHTEEPVKKDVLSAGEKPNFPPARSAAADLIQIIDYPEKNTEKPVEVQISWLPELKDIDPAEHLLLGMFLGGFAGDVSTPLYKKLVDGKSRTLNYGATGVSAGSDDEVGLQVTVSIADISAKHANESDLKVLRKLVQDELKKIADLEPGSKELAEFNRRIVSRLKQMKDSNAEFVNTPPRFGSRNLRGAWMEHLLWLDRSGGFRRSLTLKPQMDFVSSKLKEKGNIWTAYLKKWKLLDTQAQIMCLRPKPELLDKEAADRDERNAKNLEKIKRTYQIDDAQKALALFKNDYDAETQRLESLQKEAPRDMRFIDDPPLTQDDQLKYKVGTLKNGLPIVSSTFENMTISSVLFAMKVPQIPEQDLMYLSVFPQLLYRVGLIENGKPLTYEQVLDRWRDEVSSVFAYFRSNPDTKRYELAVSGEGNNPAETKRAIKWMQLVLEHPNWRLENVQRISDVVQHALSSLRKSRDSGYEENWAGEPVAGIRRQSDPLFMHMSNSMTRTHDVRRLVWRLCDKVTAKDRSAFIAFMRELRIPSSNVKNAATKSTISKTTKAAGAQLTRSRGELSELLQAMLKGDQKGLTGLNKRIYSVYAKLSGRAKQLGTDAINDLSQDLRDIPDSSLSGDWNQMCDEIIADIQISPTTTLKKFEEVRKVLVNANVGRAIFVGSSNSHNEVIPSLETMIDALPKRTHAEPVYAPCKRVFQRLIARENIKAIPEPNFLGFFNEKTTQGVISNNTIALKYTQVDDESLLRYLASQLYAGAGAHSLFMQTWAAGLAYGNGVSCTPNYRLSYYADKTPTAPQTIKFVVERLKAAADEAKKKMNPVLADYALAQAFFSYADGNFIGRGHSIADDLVDGKSPDVVRKFRKALLELRTTPDFERKLFDRMIPEYARVIPGLTPDSAQDKDGIYMVIGDRKQLKQYEDYLKAIKSKNTKLYVLYARDYWI